MADIFISYKKEDAGRVIRLVEALRAEGFSVWWDHGIQAGSEWDRSIRRELDAARVVIAIWSTASVDAPWVREEAGVGKARGILLPVKIDEVDPPLGFTLIQAADLVGWRGNREDRRWSHLMQSVHAIASGGSAPLADAPLRARPSRKSSVLMPALAAAMILVAAGGVWWLMPRGPAPDIRVPGPPTAVSADPPAQSPATSGPPGAMTPGTSPTAIPSSIPTTVPPVITPPTRPQPSPGEQALWDRAMAEKGRQGFQTYLIAYPDGAFAQRARDILLTCRSETREEWKPGPAAANQMVRGVGDTGSGLSQSQACEKAKSDVHDLAKRMCETIAHNGGFRNPRWTVSDRDCDCKQTSRVVTVCIADLPYSCMWEQKMQERVEICG